MLKMLPIVLCVMMTVACASSERTVTEGDRHLAHQNLSASEKILQEAMALKVALESAGVPTPAASLAGVAYIHQAAEDIRKNAHQQLVNWGGAPKDAQAYDPKESEKRRKESEDEHANIKWWHGLAAAAGAAAMFAAKHFGLGWIPLVGTWLKKKAPALAVGDLSKKAVTEGLQVALDEGRVQVDEAVEKLKAYLKSKLPDYADSVIDGFKMPDLKDIVIKEMERRGVLTANTLIYEANPDTGEATET